MSNILVVIPARGGSKGIPRKNLRLLYNKPLLYYSINTALNSKFKPDVYVSSEDEEILTIAKKFGAKIHKRKKELADDKTTLDPVIYETYKFATKKEKKEYEIIVTLQPTSPLLKTNSLDEALEIMIKNKKLDTIISAKDNTHLTWKKVGNKYVPNYKKRVNRQYLEPVYVETGGFLITRNNIISENNRIGKNVELYLLNNEEGIDIDTYEDWNICEYYLKRKKILFVVRGNKKIGLGHVYNTLGLANDITNHELYFLTLNDSNLAYNKILEYNYPVYKQDNNEDLFKAIKKINPDIIINDILDTEEKYVKKLKKMGYLVVNFEDLGTGSKHADIVINAIYPEKIKIKNHYYGPKYFILRDEFIYSNYKIVKKKVENVLITFGGTDPNNFTKKVLDSIYDYCVKNNIKINVITGFGYDKYNTLKTFEKINLLKNVSNISEYMLEADIIFTSAGRTIYEIASIGTPAIVMAQNEREMTHFFASEENGFVNLGLGTKISNKDIKENFVFLVKNYKKRKEMNVLMKNTDLKNGRKNVIKLINSLIEENYM